MADKTSLHENDDAVSGATVNQHRAILSIMEELEAVDWYAQRVDATDDETLRAILAHNRDEELEHAAMVIEWLRRNNATFDKFLRTYLFTDGDITELEEEDTSGSNGKNSGGTLNVGGLRGEESR